MTRRWLLARLLILWPAVLLPALPSPVAAQAGAEVSGQADEGLFCVGCGTDPSIRTRANDTLPPEVARRRIVRVDATYLQTRLVPGVGPIRLNLFPDVVVDIAAAGTQRTSTGRLIWQGRAAGGAGTATFVVAGELVTGSATVGRTTYSLLPDKAGNTVIDEIDPAGFPAPGPHPIAPYGGKGPRAIP